MIIFYRIPFVDFRNFLDIDPGKLELPFWPNPIPNKEFIKYGGQVFPRKKGGIAGWIGEMQLCNIKHAIKFQILAPFQDEKSCSDNIIKVAAKLFYHDGLSCCFIDFIFIIKDRSWANCDVPIDLLLNHIIKSRVKSRISTTEQITDYLGTSQITLENWKIE